MKKKTMISLLGLTLLSSIMIGCSSDVNVSVSDTEISVETTSETHENIPLETQVDESSETTTEENTEDTELLNCVKANPENLKWAYEYNLPIDYNPSNENVEFTTAKMNDSGEEYDSDFTLNGVCTSSFEINGDIKTETFTFTFNRPSHGYNFNGEVVDGYSGYKYNFESKVGSTYQVAEQTIYADDKSYDVSIIVDFINGYAADSPCSLTYTVTSPVDYNGALFYVGRSSKTSLENRTEENDHTLNKANEDIWFNEYIENPSPNEGRWFSLCTHEDVQ